jgi:putative ABC transport system ATP-binding protein
VTHRTELIDALSLVRRVGDQTLLDQASLTLHTGDRVALVGNSGSGKSLFLRSLAMLEPVDAGEIHWRGNLVEPATAAKYRSRVIYVHQQAADYGGTVEQVLHRPFELAVHRDRQFDHDWLVARLESVGRSAAFLDKDHQRLSGGERQLVACLRAIQLQPEVLLLDEPTAALDPTAALQVEELVDRWLGDRNGCDAAMIWVSHDHDQARRVSNMIYRMEAGSLASQTEPAGAAR